MTDDSADLADFGAGHNPEPPEVTLRQRVRSKTGGGHIGHVARVVNRGDSQRALVCKKDSHDHRIHYYHEEQGGTYAISLDALASVRGDIHRVLIHETDTGDVYEWDAAAFFAADNVPTKFLQTAGDPQRGKARETADRIWESHAPDDFYVPQGAADDPGFSAGGDSA